MKFARLDNYGRDIVRETVRISMSRCDAQGTREKMNLFWVSVDEKECAGFLNTCYKDNASGVPL